MTSRNGDDVESNVLTDFQVEVARLFFSLPASERFLLAGGAALLAKHMTARPTDDLDFFTGTPGSVESARDQFETAAEGHGWTVEVRQSTATFCRFVVHGPEDLVVDIALDSPPLQPATASLLGPTFAPEELAGRKLLALFDRAEARDFADGGHCADSPTATYPSKPPLWTSSGASSTTGGTNSLHDSYMITGPLAKDEGSRAAADHEGRRSALLAAPNV